MRVRAESMGREFRDEGRGAKGEVQGAKGEFSFSSVCVTDSNSDSEDKIVCWQLGSASDLSDCSSLAHNFNCGGKCPPKFRAQSYFII